jgi:hypothetical protein
MPPEIVKSIGKLRTLSPELNRVTDQANRAIQLVEVFLDECSVGLPCYVTVFTERPQEPHPKFNPYESDDDYEGMFLGYDRCGSRFRIVLKSRVKEFVNGATVEDAYTIESQLRPWSDSTRADKLASLPLLPKLLERIVREAQETIESAARATETIEEMIGALNAAAAENASPLGTPKPQRPKSTLTTAIKPSVR